MGIKSGIFTQNILTVIKVFAMVGIIAAGLLFGFSFETLSANLAMPADFSFDTMTIINVAIVGALFASINWNNITFIAGEVKNPSKNIPKALVGGVFLVIALYLLMNFVYIGVLPLDAIKTAPQDIVAAQTMYNVFGDMGKGVIAVIIMISALGCANGMVLSGAHVYYKMAKDRAFFRPLAFMSRKTKVPVNSLWAQCIWICALVLWGGFSQLLDFVIYASLIFYIIVTAGIFVYRKKFPNASEKNRVHNFFPIAFLIMSTYIVVCLSVFKPAHTIPGLIITLLGIPVFYIWKRKLSATRGR
jgi:APA family basic amino acid/polyamine antiporter